MSNFGLEVAFRELGIPFVRAAVGDRYVLAVLKERNGVLGGETSGHLLRLDKTTTGDGLIAALQVLAIMRESGMRLAELTAPLMRYPQKMINVRVARRFPIDGNAALGAAVRAVEAAMDGRGRVVLRASGTEPVIRVMVEGEDESAIAMHAERLAAVVRSEADRTG
jgi:phosphoglucosamine mutase